jgi:hypothetical protein
MSRLFDDTSSQYLINTSSAIVQGPPYTLACWGYCDEDGTAPTAMSIGDKDSTSFWVRLTFKGNDAGDPILFQGFDDIGANFAASTSTGFSVNTWHHLCAVAASSTSWNVLIDGGSKGTDTTSAAAWTSIDHAAIGVIARSSLGAYMSGRLAEAAIWSAALTDPEVATLAAGYSPLFVRPASLVAYWPLIGRTSPEIDIVGGYDMTLTNSPTTAAHSRIIYPGAQSIMMPQESSPIGQQFILPPYRPIIS